ncbi:single-strand DNA-binding protein, partial [Tremellales sp. Uapishka_1]
MFRQSLLSSAKAVPKMQARAYSKATIIGRLGAPPVEKTSANGKPYFHYPLAVSKPPKKNADGNPIRDTNWFTIFAFNPRFGEYASSMETGNLYMVEAEIDILTGEANADGFPTKEITLREITHRILDKKAKAE